MTYLVPIERYSSDGDGGAEHVDGLQPRHQLTHGAAQWPVLHEQLDQGEGHAECAHHHVRDRQVHYEQVTHLQMAYSWSKKNLLLMTFVGYIYSSYILQFLDTYEIQSSYYICICVDKVHFTTREVVKLMTNSLHT